MSEEDVTKQNMPGKIGRRTFLQWSTLAAASGATLTEAISSPIVMAKASTTSFQLEEATIAELQAAMASGQLTARQLVEL